VQEDKISLNMNMHIHSELSKCPSWWIFS